MTKQELLQLIDNSINQNYQVINQTTNSIMFIQIDARLSVLKDVRNAVEQLDEPSKTKETK